VTNALQTNGIVLDDDWCVFLAQHGFLVGLSLDGPADIQDASAGDIPAALQRDPEAAVHDAAEEMVHQSLQRAFVFPVDQIEALGGAVKVPADAVA